MEKIISLIFGLLLITYSNVRSGDLNPVNSAAGDSLIIMSAPDLYALSLKWSVEYSKLFPDKPVKVISITDNKIPGRTASDENIAFVTGEFNGFDNQSLWRVVVGRDLIVPVINSKNPDLNEIISQGVSQASIADLLKKPGTMKWSMLLKNKDDKPVNVYLVNDKSVKSVLADYIKTEVSGIHATEFNNSKELLSALKKDPYAIAFCKMIDVVDFNNQSVVENIRLLPIDRNGNGKIDYNEKIYDNYNVFLRGVWIGKYPKALFCNIYSVCSTRPKNESGVAFLKWVFTDGQKFLFDNGFSDLLLSERQTAIDILNSSEVYSTTKTDDNFLPKIALIILASLVVIGLTIDTILRITRRRKANDKPAVSGYHSILDEKSVSIPGGLYFDKSHTWAFMDQDGIVKVGVDDFLQHVTGPVTRIRMKEMGKKVRKGDTIMSVIQHGKQLNLYAPVSGTIIEQNKLLESDSSLINTSPYNSGWVYRIKPDNWKRESQLLFMADKQKEHIKEEFSRLRDFLALVLNQDKVLYALAVLQDGGQLNDGVLSDFGPEVWEDFQTKFIDPSKQLWFYEII